MVYLPDRDTCKINLFPNSIGQFRKKNRDNEQISKSNLAFFNQSKLWIEENLNDLNFHIKPDIKYEILQ